MTEFNPDSGEAAPRTSASSATDFWNDMFQGTASFWQDQHRRFFSALEQMKEGNYGPTEFMQDLAASWEAWLGLMASPGQAGVRQERQLPTLLFVVDGEAEFIGPTDAPTHVFLPPGVTTSVTDLYPVGANAAAIRNQGQGPGSINGGAHVRAGLSPARDRVEVSLVDLGRGQARRALKGISPGLYVGAVYATELATRRPLAIIYVLVEESAVP